MTSNALWQATSESQNRYRLTDQSAENPIGWISEKTIRKSSDRKQDTRLQILLSILSFSRFDLFL